MKNLFRFTCLGFGVIIAMGSCNQRAVLKASSDHKCMIDSILFEAHLDSLSSDHFIGRMPFSEGDVLTTNYLVNVLRSYGLEPGNGASYLQEVPMVEIDGHPSPSLDIHMEDMVLPFELGTEFMIHSERPSKRLTLDGSQLVFCGYGIVAPEYNWNDYEGVDMKGKTAVVLVNDPGLGGEDSTFFKGDQMTYYGRWTYKYEEADRQGASGLLLIHETHMAGYPWQVVSSSWSGPQLHLDRGESAQDCGIKGWIHLQKAKECFSLMGHDLSALIKSSRKPGFKPVELIGSVYVNLDNDIQRNRSSNVVALKRGTTRPDEMLVVTAHWDHLGIGPAVDGDSIYNGALDNASGTALALSMAETISKSEWDRSVLFLFVTAEEQGLIGSRWYAENPLFPLSQTVANLNIDGINIVGPSNDLTITGLGHSDMDDIAISVAHKQGRYVQGETEPEKGYFFRSDHFSFAQKGVPALYAKGGQDHLTLGPDYSKAVSQEYVEKNYHQPSDQYISGQWDLRGAIQDGELFIEVLERLANSPEWPRWKSGSEFKNSDPRKRNELRQAK